MTNEELKKKIVDILNKIFKERDVIPVHTAPDGKKTALPDELCEIFNNIVVQAVIPYFADALIAAGIGDVGETKEKLKKINERILLGDIIACDLSAKCAEYKYLAAVSEREAIILSKWLADKTRKDYPYQAWLEAAQKQAEKELAEEWKDD